MARAQIDAFLDSVIGFQIMRACCMGLKKLCEYSLLPSGEPIQSWACIHGVLEYF